MKSLITKTMVFALMLALVFTMTPQFAPKVHADSGDPAMVMGTSVLSKNVSQKGLQKIWFGRYDSPQTKKRGWYVIGYDGQGVNPASREGVITILHQSADLNDQMTWRAQETMSNANCYAASDIRWAVNAFYNGHGDWKWNDSKEKGIVVPRTLEGGGNNHGQEGYDKNKIKGDSVENAYFWLLSVGETEALPGSVTYLYNDTKWWLRSPGSRNDKAAYCGTEYNLDYAYIAPDGVATDAFYRARPACDLDMNAILFTSAASGGKVSGSGADALTAVGANTNSEWKLTIKDASRNAFGITTCEGSYDSSSGAVTFCYSGAKVEEDSYISAVIVGSDGSINYYGRLAEVSEASGQVTVNTSGKLDSGDKLFVYNEQYNGDKTTDYASELKEVDLAPTGAHEWAEATCTDPKTCTICGTTDGDALGHSYQEVAGTAEAPTCTGAGKKADQQCSVCGDVVDGAAIPATGHSWGEWRESTTGGTTHKIHNCTVCGVEEEITIEEGHQHTYPNMGYSPGEPATCTVTGIRKHYECSCGYWFEEGDDGAPTGDPKTSDDFVIPAAGHEWENAACTQPKTCKRCGATQGSPLGHDRLFTGWTWNGNEDNGYTEATAHYVCKNCSDEAVKSITTLTVTVIKPTCTEGGKTVYKASIKSVDAYDLTSRSEKKEAKFTGPSGHKWNDGVVTKEATKTEEGEKLFTCTVCEETKTEVIPMVQPDKKNIENAEVALSAKAFTYNGKAQKPAVTVKLGGTTLKENTDYTVSYAAGRKNVGQYKVTVKGKGNYIGSKAVVYQINPKGTKIKKPKKAKKAITVKWKKQKSKMSKSRISGYQIQVATDEKFTQNTKTVTVKKYKKTSKKIKKLKGKTKYYVHVRTYKTVSGVRYYSPWSKTKTVKTK